MLGLDKGWSPGRIAQLVESGPQDNQIALSTRIPVHVVYFTAWVDEDGKPQYRKDHYGHDNRITQALAGTPVSVIARSDPALIQERSVKEARQRMLEQPRRYSSQGGGGGGGSPFGSIFSWILN
jgi:hypothetical protein